MWQSIASHTVLHWRHPAFELNGAITTKATPVNCESVAYERQLLVLNKA